MLTTPRPTYIYLNKGNGTFEDVSYGSGFALNADARETASLGLAVGDYMPQQDPKVRVLLVDTTGTRAVYEGIKRWSKCKRWIERLQGIPNPEDELGQICKTFMRAQFAVIQEAQATLEDLASFGLHRADR